MKQSLLGKHANFIVKKKFSNHDELEIHIQNGIFPKIDREIDFAFIWRNFSYLG